MKKLTSIMVTFMVLAIGLVMNVDEAYASEDWTQAVQVSVNQDIHGTITDGYHKQNDIYKFTLNKDGVVTVAFSNPQQPSADEYWKVKLVNSSYETILEEKVKGNKSYTELTKTGLGAGSYYAVVSSTRGYNAASEDPYTINLKYEGSEFWERELNEDYPNATRILVNNDYRGTVDDGYHHETDFYRFSLEKAGRVAVKVSYPLQAAADAYWNVTLFNGSYDEIASWDLSGSHPENTLTSVGLLKGDYYLKFVSTKGYEPKSTDTYIFKAKYEPSDFWEKELNEDFASASEMSLDRTYYGAVHDGYHKEKDYFYADVLYSGTYDIRFSNELQGSSNSYWNMYVYDKNYNQINKIQIHGDEDLHSIRMQMDPGRYYVCVTSSKGYEPASDSVYGLTFGIYRSIKDAVVTGVNNSYTYTGSRITPEVSLTYNGEVLTEGVDYNVSYGANTKAGNGTVKITGLNAYSDSVTYTFKIKLLPNTAVFAARNVKVKYSAVKKKARKIPATKVFVVSNPIGKVSYKKVGGTGRITVSDTGQIKIKKGTKKKNYTIKVKAKAAGDAYHAAASQVLTFKVKVK